MTGRLRNIVLYLGVILLALLTDQIYREHARQQSFATAFGVSAPVAELERDLAGRIVRAKLAELKSEADTPLPPLDDNAALMHLDTSDSSGNRSGNPQAVQQEEELKTLGRPRRADHQGGRDLFATAACFFIL